MVSKIKHNWIWCILLSILSIFTLTILYINLSITPSFYCSDMYSDMMLAKEIWEQKTIFPNGWVYGNQLYAVATPILAALFYGITGTPFIATGLASSLMGALVAITFCWMLKPVYDKQTRIFALAFFMTLVLFFGDAYEKTNGWQLFFTMCTYYACYAMTAFLAFGCYLRSNLCWSHATWIIFGVTCILSFGTGIQSLRQTAVMCLPLLAVEFLHLIDRIRHKTNIWSKSLAIILTLTVCNVLGLFLKGFISISQVEIFGQTAFVPFTQLGNSFNESIINISTLFIRAEEFPLYIGVIVAVMSLFTAFSFLLYTLKNKYTVRQDVLLLFLCSVLCIFAIDVVLSMSVRPLYYFMIFPMISILITQIFAKTKRKMITMVLLLGLFGSACYMELYPACKLAYVADHEVQLYEEVSNYLVTNGYETVYSRWNRGEKIAIASNGAVEAGFWLTPFEGVTYICNPNIYIRDNDTAIYYFDNTANAEDGVKRAKTQNIELELVQYFVEYDVYLYKSPVNLMAIFTPEL